MSLSLLAQAKDGDAAAISALMNQTLEPKGMSVRCDRQGDCLQFWLSGQTIPSQAATIAYVRQVMERLQVSAPAALQIYAQPIGHQQPDWGVEILLNQPTAEIKPLALEHPSIVQADLPEAQAVEPEIATEAAPLLAAPGTIDYAYALLGLEPGDSLQKVEGTYFKLKALALREGNRSQVEDLKQAFRQIKEYIEHPPAKEEPARVTVGDANQKDSGQEDSGQEEVLTPLEQVEKLLKQRQVPAQAKLQGSQLHVTWLDVRVINSKEAASQVHALLTQRHLASIGLDDVDALVISGLSRDHQVIWQQTYALTTR